MLLDISRSFGSRRLPGASDQQIERIVKSYRRWKLIQSRSRVEYHVSREWLPIYEQYMGDVISALADSNVLLLKEMYENFFRHPLSTGLHGMNFEMVQRYMSPGVVPDPQHLQDYLKFCTCYAVNFLLNCRDVPISSLWRPSIGNPYGYTLDGVEIFPCAEYHFYYARKIASLLRRERSPVVMELGGGFGGMAYYLLRDSPHVKYIGIDLPENAALQAYYLISHFPDAKIGLYGEEEFNLDGDFNVLIMPSFAIESLSENSVHLSFNSYSLAEMSLVSAHNYVDLVCKISKEFILHLNHVYWEVSADNFPIDYTKFQLMFRNPTMWGKDPANYALDHHEFLYMAK